MIRKQDVAVLLVYCTGYTALRNLLLRLVGKPVTTIVAFHDVHGFGAYESFFESIELLYRAANTISLDDYFAGKVSSQRPNVVVTFDDGYRSWVSKAAPILRRFGVPATFFISSGSAGLSREQQELFIRQRLRLNSDTSGLLSIEEIVELERQGFSIGGHTCSHVDLSEIRDPNELENEILTDKSRLEEMIGKEIRYFAYPFGRHRNNYADLSNILRKANYRGGVTTLSGYNTKHTDPFCLKRELTGVPMSALVFKARALGASECVHAIKGCGSVIGHRIRRTSYVGGC